MAPKPITPIYKKFDVERDAWIWGLTKEDFERVRLGYGCDKCLEPFDSPKLRCPVCGNSIQVLLDTPEGW